MCLKRPCQPNTHKYFPMLDMILVVVLVTHAENCQTDAPSSSSPIPCNLREWNNLLTDLELLTGIATMPIDKMHNGVLVLGSNIILIGINTVNALPVLAGAISRNVWPNWSAACVLLVFCSIWFVSVRPAAPFNGLCVRFNCFFCCCSFFQ